MICTENFIGIVKEQIKIMGYFEQEIKEIETKAKAQGRSEVIAEIKQAVNNEISKDHINFNHADIETILDKLSKEGGE